jgi:hypothetical protein
MYGRRRTETHRCWRRVLPAWLSVAVVLSGVWVAEAQAQTEPCPADQPTDSCCTPRPSANEADEEEGLEQDCPPADDSAGARSHRRGDDAVLDDNDTGSADGSFRSGRGFRRGSGDGGEAPGGSGASGGPGEAPGDGTGGGPGGVAPGGGTTGGVPTGSGPRAGSGAGARGPSGAPSVRAPSGAPSVRAPSTAAAGTSASGGSTSTAGVREGAGAAQAGGSIARTGGDIGTPLGLAMTLLLAGTSLRRANRPLPRTPRRGRPARPPEPALPDWNYVDNSSSARAIEKF